MIRHFHQRPRLAFFPLACLMLLLSACGSAYSPSNTSSSPAIPSSTTRSQSTTQPDTTATQVSTTTVCPAAGTARPAIMTPMTQGQHANILYVYEQGTYPKISKSTIKRYDVTTGQKTDILSINNATGIGWTQLSADGQWILFVAQIGGKDALQLVRVDGQLQQTLFCLDPTKDIDGLAWSPDQKHVLLNLVNTGIANQPPSPLQIDLLDITNGQIQAALNQPENVTPIAWFDNTKILLGDDGVAVGDGRDHSPLLLDISKGLPQQANNLQKLVNDYPCGDFARDADGASVLIAQCTMQGEVTGPSKLTLQPIAGGPARTILIDKTMGITGVRPISNSALLFLVQSFAGNTSKNGLWKVNIDGTHLTRLFAATQNSLFEQLGDPGSTWSTISRDNSMYSLQQDDATNQPVKTTLLFGSLNGGAVTAFASLSHDQGSLNMIGWTTM